MHDRRQRLTEDGVFQDLVHDVLGQHRQIPLVPGPGCVSVMLTQLDDATHQLPTIDLIDQFVDHVPDKLLISRGHFSPHVPAVDDDDLGFELLTIAMEEVTIDTTVPTVRCNLEVMQVLFTVGDIPSSTSS